MTPETFFEKFDLLADAPDAVKRMRELVLELAVQGKLSERQASDEKDAAWLKLTKHLDDDSVASNTNIEPPFEIPSGWKWITLERLGDTKPRNEASDITTSSFVPMTLIPTEYGQSALHEERPWGKIKRGYTHFQDGDVVMAKITPCFENGKSALMKGLTGGFGAGTTELHVFRRSSDAVLPEFVLLYLKTRGFITRGIPKMTGSAGQKRVPSDYFARSPFPLPPLAEQKRIVAKVDELMALCDRLEAQQQERETRHAALVSASLARFAESPTPANLQFLFHPSCTISPADLRKSILTLAVQGKLVPQDPNDEPAEEVLARIAATKLRLQKTGEIGKENAVEQFQPDSLPFEVPDSWRWAKLSELTELITKGSSPKWQGIAYVSESEGILFITSENVGNYVLRKLDNLKYVSKGFNEIEPRSILKRGDILMNLVGASIGRTAVYDLHDGANINQAVALIRLVRDTDGVSPRFLLHYLNSPSAIDHMLSSRVVNAQPNISLTDAREFAVPVPPLAEQRRIVAKVEQLMALVDALEKQLAASRATATNLLTALIAELTTGKEAHAADEI